jgi:hypothetical protein
MPSVILCVLGAFLVTTTAVPAGDEKANQTSRVSYVKVRVEVGMRGVLAASDKAVTVAARDRVYNLFSDA